MLSVFDHGPYAPCPAPFNMAAHVLAHADRLSDKVALSILGLTGAERWSYARLAAAVRGTATGLLQNGFAPGDILLMRIGNSVDFPIAYLGAIAAGMVPVPTSSQLTEGEVAKMLEGLSPAGILRDPAVACPGTQIPTLDTAALRDMRDLPPAEYHMGDPERLGYIVYTSGTSGKPRAVMHAHRAIWARRMMHRDWYELGEEDRLLHAGAFNWTYTLGTGLMDPWSVGATALIPAEDVKPEALPLLLKRHEATIFAAAPGVYRKILNQNERIVLPKLRHGLTAGEKVSDHIRNAWRAAGVGELYEAFGMSECSTFISGSPAAPAKPGALGKPQEGRRVAILGPDGPVPLGEEGVIAVHRDDPGLMLGYLGAMEEAESRMQGDWFLTGDHGRMDEDGQITYMARADDMMNAGGYRVSPIEVEAALHDLPGVTEIGVTDCEVKEDARLIIAFYTAPEPQDEARLKAVAAERLARYKQPRAFVHIPEMPRNPNGKLLRRALRDIWAARNPAK
jgi:acyl-coenzyme A synthetase/AMP-(fatty) acid ligase